MHVHNISQKFGDDCQTFLKIDLGRLPMEVTLFIIENSSHAICDKWAQNIDH